MAEDRSIRRWLRHLGVPAVALLTGCAVAPGTPPVVAPLAADEARIFLYRDNEIYESLDWVPVTFNGRKVGAVGPGLFFYRDITPGTYRIDVISESLWPDQAKTVAAHAGETLYAKVEALRDSAASDSSDMPSPTFIIAIMEPAVGRGEINGLTQAVEH